MNHQELAQTIIEKMGGKSNISQCWHCITRLRFNVKDDNKIKLDEIKALDGVIGAQFQSGQFQIIIGNEVANVYEEIHHIIGDGLDNDSQSSGKNGNILDRIFDVISGIFNPILAAITGSGLLKGLMTILVATNLLSDQSSTYAVLDAISNAAFHFLPFLIAFSAASKFRANQSLAVALAGILMYPTFLENAASGEIASLKFIGLTIPMNNYASSVIPIILGVWLLSYVEKYMKKWVPSSLSIIFVPMLSLLITAPILLAFIAPLGTTIGSYLERFFTTLFDVAGPLAGALMGGLMPLIVITGMHYAFFPGTFASFEKFSYDIMLLPMNLVANLAQAGATLGVFIKTKDSKMKQLAFSSFIPAVFGITEPAIYGVTMKLKKPFYASMMGGAVGGAIFGAFTVKAMSFTVPGVLAIPTYLDSQSNNLLFALMGVGASFAIGLVMTLVLKFDTGASDPNEKEKETKTVVEIQDKEGPISIVSPLKGEVVSLEECPDETFASGIVGKGIGIYPTEGLVKAPFNGTVTMTTPTNHAIGILSDEGVELLIHVGLDTVDLKGKGFERLVEEGAAIKQGDSLLTFDIAFLKAQNINLFSPVVVTNTPNFLDVVPTTTNKTAINAINQEILVAIK